MQHALHISFEVEVQTGTKVFRLPKLPCTVGRARWAGVRLKHLSVLESHATVQLVDGKVVMTPDDPQQPLRTTAGPSNWIVLTDGMKVYVGEVPLRVRFTIGSTSDPAATTAPKAAMPTRPQSVQPPAAPSGAPVPIAAPMAVPGPVARPATVLAEPFPTRGVGSASVPPPAPVNSRQPSVTPQPTTALNSASVPQPTTTSPVFSHVPSPTPAGTQAPQPIDSWSSTQASPMPSHVAHGAWNHSALPAPQNRSTLAGPAQTSAVPFAAYQPSGSIPSTWPIIAAMGITAAFIVGGIYGWVNVYFPVVGIVTLLIAAGASYLIGMAISLGIKVFSLRNPIIAAAIGGASGLLLIPFAWLSFLTVLYWSRTGAPLVRTWIECATSPIDVARNVYGLFSEGWTSIGHTNISGFPLLAGWLIEAGCFIGFATYVAWQAARKPFDEQLGTWHSPQPFGTAFALPGEDPASITRFPAERLPELLPSSPQSPHLLLTFYESGTGGTASVGTLPLVAIDRVVFKDKKADKVRVMEPHYIPPEIVQHLRTFHTFVAPT